MSAGNTPCSLLPGQVLTLVSITPQKNRYRYYTLSWQATLWGEWVLVRRWGRIGARGRCTTLPFPDGARAQAAIARILAARQRHGYQEIASE